MGCAASGAVVGVVFWIGEQYLGTRSLKQPLFLSSADFKLHLLSSEANLWHRSCSGLPSTTSPHDGLGGISGTARDPRPVLMQAYAVAGSPAMLAAGCSPSLAASRKRGQRASNSGWAVLRQARGCQTRELPAGHLGTFLRRRLLRMRYTASCVQMYDARIRGERHSNRFACNIEVT